MPAALPYSTSFFRLPGVAGGPYDAYVVPGGYRAVVKCISVVWGDIVVSKLDVWVEAGSTVFTKLVRVSQYPNVTDIILGGSEVWFGSWVLGEFEVIRVVSNYGTTDIQASGYLLTD